MPPSVILRQMEDLDVPVAYVSPEGYALGKWVRRQQYAYRNPEKSNAILSQERIELLDAIGMQWEKPDPWQHRYELAQEYKRCNMEIWRFRRNTRLRMAFG